MSEKWAKIKKGKSFSGVNPGEIYPTVYGAGDVVKGALAQIAMDQGLATEGKGTPPEPAEKMQSGAPENKDGTAIGERLVYLQNENVELTGFIEQQNEILLLMGVPEEFCERLKSVNVSGDELADFKKQIESARTAKSNEKPVSRK